MLGFNTDFLGSNDKFTLELPTLGPDLLAQSQQNGRIFDYVHFSLAMHQKHKTAIYVAHNINQNQMVRVRRGPWQKDYRMGKDNQLDDDFYSGTDFDRGHLARREALCWGLAGEAIRANEDSFYFTNAAPQHENFNRDEWKELEDWLLDLTEDKNGLISAFSGPIYTDRDSEKKGVRIPSEFYMLVAFRGKRGKLLACAFLMPQDEMWTDNDGELRRKKYQITVTELEKKTGLEFDEKLKAASQLYYSRSGGPERREIGSATDIATD